MKAISITLTRAWAALKLLFCCVLGVVFAVCLVAVGSYYFCMVLGGLTIGRLTASRRARKGVGLESAYVSHWWPTQHGERSYRSQG
jgi:hypothetical protein